MSHCDKQPPHEPDLRQRVEDFLAEVVSPVLEGHGGGLELREMKGQDIGLVLTGHCSACPSAQITVEEVIESCLRTHFGKEIGRVYLINETDEDVLAFAKELLNLKE